MNVASPSLMLGKYRLIIELAQGGMGCVYLAVAQGPGGFSKLSVIKALKPALAEEQGFLEMFLDEARLCARLSHPNVVQTNDVAVDAGGAWLAMEYLDGQSLVRMRARLARQDRLPLAVHLRIIAEACHGLHYAHELRDFDGTALGVVHRDVSPHNVFVTYDGQVKIVDFGVAKALRSSHETTAGVMKGKVPYMAPEQVLGEVVDRRADIFAVGVMLWEAVANRRMWDQLRVETIIARLMVGDVPRIAEAVPGAPPRLVTIIQRATAARPDARYSTIEELRLDLEACIADLGGADGASLRELGRIMGEAFAPERAMVNEAIQAQLRVLNEATPSQNVAIVAIPFPKTTGSFNALPMAGPMGSQLLPTIAASLDRVGGSGKTSASMAVAASRPPPSVKATAKPGVVVAAVALSLVVVAAAGFGLRLVVGSRPSERVEASAIKVGETDGGMASTGTTGSSPAVPPSSEPAPPRGSSDGAASSRAVPPTPRLAQPPQPQPQPQPQHRRPGADSKKPPTPGDDLDVGF